jgi:FSR family fosmidomycin resistance protein-like MFS transporter
VLAGFSALAPALLIFVLFGPLNGLLAFVLLLPIGLALFAPASVMVVMGQEYLPANIGIASGVTLGLAVSVGGITTPFYGHLADLYGVQASLIGLIIVPVLAVAVTLALPRDRRKRVQREQTLEEAS